MSSDLSTPSASQPSKAQRILACVLCQQRKVKCDRKFPCQNCIRSRVQCIPAGQLPQRPRRRRFPERELLDQIRKYEDLLRKNGIKFEPLHRPTGVGEHAGDGANGSEEDEDGQGGGGNEAEALTSIIRSGRISEAKNFWQTLRQGLQDLRDEIHASHDDPDEAEVRKVWDQSSFSDDLLIFGPLQPMIDLSTFHPEPVQIFKFWQIFADNVNPLFRVVHGPTMQTRILEAVGDLKKISPVMDALMFSIYSTATLSVAGEECQSMFGASKSDLLMKYQFGCRQALVNCRFLRSSERESLTALFLYLVTVASSTDPRALSSMLGLAIRIAQRLKLDAEAKNAKCDVLEGEMRRRLWWALLLFDARIGEMAAHKTQILTPTWDCSIPLNVSDADLRADMKNPPIVRKEPTEAIFVVVRGQLGDFLRNSTFHLDYTAPDLKPISRIFQNGKDGEIHALEKTIEEKYLKHCDPENPLQFLTIWETRAHLTKWRLMETYSKASNSSSSSRTEGQLDAANALAIRTLECDTQIMKSPLTKGYQWMAHYQFPFPAYIHLFRDLRKRPLSKHAEHAWEVMSANCDSRFDDTFQDNGNFFTFFARLVLHSWHARESAMIQTGERAVPPKIVNRVSLALQRMMQEEQLADSERLAGGVGPPAGDFPTPMSMDAGGYNAFAGGEGSTGFAEPGSGAFYGLAGAEMLDFDVGQFNWGAADWGFGPRPAW